MLWFLVRLQGKLLLGVKGLKGGRSASCGRGQNTDPQSMDYLNGLPKWTTPESHLKGEKRLFEARHIIVLTIPYAFALETFHTCDPLVSLHNPNPNPNPNPSNSCFSPFKWLSGVVHLGNPFRQSMDWGSVFCPLPQAAVICKWNKIKTFIHL